MTKYGKIYPVSFGFAWGILAGISLLLLGWAGARWGFGQAYIFILSKVCHHYAPTFIGGLWGFVWGFIYNLVFGVLLATVYNWSLCCFAPSESCDNKSCDNNKSCH